MRIEIEPVRSPQDLESARELFVEYAESLGFSLCFQGFDLELAGLPGRYAAPGGEIFLARIDGAVAGVGAFRPLEDDVCEMKRMFVRPSVRGHNLGRRLAEAIVTRACEAGYRRMRLDTMRTMTTAIALYESLGFREIPAYYENPLEGVRYFELTLSD